jgi:hypothetical protein
MTRAWGMPTSFVYRFYFLSLEIELGPIVSPLPLTGLLLQFLSELFITMVLSVEETLMYFSYMYAPNLTHQRTFVITEIPSSKLHANGYKIQHLQTPIISPTTPKMHFQEEKTIQLNKH